jgi:hypothetical protein
MRGNKRESLWLLSAVPDSKQEEISAKVRLPAALRTDRQLTSGRVSVGGIRRGSRWRSKKGGGNRRESPNGQGEISAKRRLGALSRQKGQGRRARKGSTPNGVGGNRRERREISGGTRRESRGCVDRKSLCSRYLLTSPPFLSLSLSLYPKSKSRTKTASADPIHPKVTASGRAGGWPALLRRSGHPKQRNSRGLRPRYYGLKLVGEK